MKTALKRAGARRPSARTPSDPSVPYFTGGQLKVNDVGPAERPISGRLGPGTVIACAVEAELWPEWTDTDALSIILAMEDGS